MRVPNLMTPAPTSTRAAAAPVMSEMANRRAMLLGLGAAVVAATPLAASAAPASAVPIWKTSKTAIGAKNAPPTLDGANKCTVVKPCTSGAGLKWDPKALGVSKGAMAPDGSTPRKFLKKA